MIYVLNVECVRKFCGYQNTPEFNKVKSVCSVASKDEETLKSQHQVVLLQNMQKVF